MIVTVEDLKANLDKYLVKLEEEDIFITKNDKIVARLTKSTATSSLDKLVGFLGEQKLIEKIS